MKLDHVNRRIIESLQRDGRRSFTAIARELGISETAVRARVQKLTEAGVIEVVAVTNPLMVGFDVMAMIGVKASGRLQEIADEVSAWDETSYVVILSEWNHLYRIIPLDGRPHLPPDVQQWMGDSRGHWEGDTLVVETTNYHDDVAFNSYNCCPGAGRHLHIVERYRRVSADAVDFRFTVNDPTTFTKPFTIELPMTRTNGPLYEYACHEGNDGMAGILSGARAMENGPECGAKAVTR